MPTWQILNSTEHLRYLINNTIFYMQVSDMIVTSLAANGNNVWTGGWDGIVRKFKIAGSKLEAAGEINLGGCINSLASADDRVYAAVAGGKVVCVTQKFGIYMSPSVISYDFDKAIMKDSLFS